MAAMSRCRKSWSSSLASFLISSKFRWDGKLRDILVPLASAPLDEIKEQRICWEANDEIPRKRTLLVKRSVSEHVTSNEKGPAISPAPCYCIIGLGLPQRAPAVAARAGVPTFTLICFGLASSRFGMLRVSTPF